MSHVFISYSHKDADFVEELLKELKNAEIDYWLDKEFLHAGDHWEQEIDKAIEDALAFLLVMSPNAKDSEYVTYEWAYAFGVGTKIIPIYLETVEWHPKLHPSKIQFIDFREGKKQFSDLISSIQHLQNPSLEQSDYLNKNKYLALQGDTELVRQKAIEDIVKYQDAQVPDILAAIIQEARLNDVKVFSAIRLADKFDDERAISGLLTGIRENNLHRERAISTIKKFGEKAVDGLIELLDAEWSEARYEAARFISEYKAEAACQKLADIIATEEHLKVCVACVRALVAIRCEASIRSITNLITERHMYNGEIVDALIQFDSVEIASTLIYTLKSVSVNRNIADYFRKYGEDLATYLINGFAAYDEIQSPDSRINYLTNLIHVSRYVPSKDLVPVILKYLDSPLHSVRINVPVVLANISDTRAIQPMLDRLKVETQSGIRGELLLALAKFEDIEDSFFVDYAKNAVFLDRKILASIFRNKGSDISINALIGLLRDKNYDIQLEAVKALEYINTPEALQAVQEWEKHRFADEEDT